MPRSFQELIFGYETNQNNGNNQKGGKRKTKRNSNKYTRKAKGKLSIRKRNSLSQKKQRKQSRRRNNSVNHQRYGIKSNNQFIRELNSMN